MIQNRDGYSFEEGTKDWLNHLREHGYVVVKGVVSQEEVKTAKNLFWDWLESLGAGVNRNDISTWNDNNWPGSTVPGFCNTFGGSHCDAAWYLRSLNRVKSTFAHLWDTDDLLVSMDTFILWRPWWHNEEWTPTVERLHCDQNPVRKPGFHCVQGMIPLLPVTKRSGGLQVVPDTNTDEAQEYLKNNYRISPVLDWCQLRENDKYIGTGMLLEVDPGDLILWDSRTIHGGLVGTGEKHAEDLLDNPELARLSLTVCMAPTSKATPQVLKQRRMAVENGWGLTHWPYEFARNQFGNTNGSNIKNFKYKPPQLTPEQLKLVG